MTYMYFIIFDAGCNIPSSMLMLYYLSKLSFYSTCSICLWVQFTGGLSVGFVRSLHMHVAIAVCGGVSVIHMAACSCTHTLTACKIWATCTASGTNGFTQISWSFPNHLVMRCSQWSWVPVLLLFFPFLFLCDARAVCAAVPDRHGATSGISACDMVGPVSWTMPLMIYNNDSLDHQTLGILTLPPSTLQVHTQIH